MSTITPTKKPKRKSNKTQAVAPRAALRESEAPDRGSDPSRREAPDSGRFRIAEAPDAGDGRASSHESEFTHGRSQS